MSKPDQPAPSIRQRATSSGIRLKASYNSTDLAGFDPASALGAPGEYPFTRGVQPDMYRGRLWTMRQYAGFGSARESNQRYRYLLSQGTTGLSIAFDLPTQMGMDSDHPLAYGEVGRVGVAVAHLGDMRRLLEEIPLDRVSSSMTINATAGILLAYYVSVAAEQGVASAQLRGTVQNDILKEYIARGTYIYPVAAGLRLVTDIFEYCAREIPEWNSISISGYHMREAGCTAAQELAFTLGNGMAYVEAALERGLELDQFAPRLSFFFNAHNNLFEEIAKFRAARRMWARRMRELYGAKNPRSWMLRFHTQTAGSTLTAQQPQVNVVRTAYQALAAVLGGTQSLHTNSYDEALGLPTEEAARVALRTQQVLANETGVADVVDPLAGSYYLESLTNELEEKAEQLLQRVATLGDGSVGKGMLRGIETGFVQREIQSAAYAAQRRMESGEQVVVGVNQFVSEPEGPMNVLRIDAELEAAQCRELQQWRRQRDRERAAEALAAVTAAARGGDNLMPKLVAAVQAGCTTGEMAEAMEKIFGRYQEAVVL